MKCPRSLVLVLVLVLALSALLSIPRMSVQAASPALSADLYPQATQIVIMSPASNEDVDCGWSFDCIPVAHNCGDPCPHGITTKLVPQYHVRRQDQLHRSEGWMQFGYSLSGTASIEFGISLSHYGSSTVETGSTWARDAADEFLVVTRLRGFAPVPHSLLVPAGSTGVGSEVVWQSAHFMTVAAVYVEGSTEIEAQVCYPRHHGSIGTIARSALARQLEAAIAADEHVR